jgi:hypothetical protein
MSGIDLTLQLDLSEVTNHTKKLVQGLESRLAVAAENLAIQAHAHVREKAQGKLKSRLDLFMENLELETLDKGVYAVTIKEKARWIEDGMEPHSMLEDLLRSPKARTAKDGSRYLIVPFKHNVAPSKQTPLQSELLGHLKNALKSKNIPYQKIERNPDGSARTGLLHGFDLHGPKRKTPGEGAQGPLGRPYSAHSLGTAGEQGPAGRPYLWGVRIYQRMLKNPDGSQKMTGKGQPAVGRDIFTFRVASSKQSNKWFHPGTPPMHFLDDAYEWAKRQWDEVIAPKIAAELEVADFSGTWKNSR